MTRSGLAPIIIIIAVALAAALGGYAVFSGKSFVPREIACTMEAKLCPDGTVVVRTEPNCEFAECPIAVSTSTVTKQSSTKTEDISAWKTYQNYKHGFELKSPRETSIESRPDGMPSVSFDADAVLNAVWVYNMSGLSIKEYFDGNPGQNLVGTTKPENIKRVMVGGLEATLFVPSDLPYQRYVIVLLEDRFLLFNIFVRGLDKDKKDALFDKIISTFTFIDPLDVAAWNTYRDNENRFQFKYPKILRWEVGSNQYAIGYPAYDISFFLADQLGAVDPVIIIEFNGKGLVSKFVSGDFENLESQILSTFRFFD